MLQIIDIDNSVIKDKILISFSEQFDLLFMTIDGQQQFISQTEKFAKLLNLQRIIPMHHWSDEYLQDFLSYLIN